MKISILQIISQSIIAIVTEQHNFLFRIPGLDSVTSTHGDGERGKGQVKVPLYRSCKQREGVTIAVDELMSASAESLLDNFFFELSLSKNLPCSPLENLARAIVLEVH